MQRGLNVSQPHLFTAHSKWYLNVGWGQTKVGRSFVQHGWWGNFKVLFIPPNSGDRRIAGWCEIAVCNSSVAMFSAAYEARNPLTPQISPPFFFSFSLHTDAHIALLTKPSFPCSRQLFARLHHSCSF